MSKVLTSLTDTHVKEVVMLDIAVLSMAMSQAALYQNVQMSLTKTALDTAEQSAQQARRHGAGATSRFRTSY